MTEVQSFGNWGLITSLCSGVLVWWLCNSQDCRSNVQLNGPTDHQIVPADVRAGNTDAPLSAQIGEELHGVSCRNPIVFWSKLLLVFLKHIIMEECGRRNSAS